MPCPHCADTVRPGHYCPECGLLNPDDDDED